ncbi:type II secretion system F family protein [Ornithinimicrobium panacihumi]|uniref:type II secretion system F family protein n=1 Tax=Ornithinimicrobium panacihumi TaxID=2008449 RepID=UPI003F8AAD00
MDVGLAAMIIFPTAIVLVLLLGLRGWRLLRSTGLEAVEERFVSQVADQPERVPLMIRVLDGLGRRSEQALLRLYGDRRLSALDRRLDRAGRPEGLRVRTYVRRQAGFFTLGAIIFAFFFLAGQPVIGIFCFVAFASWMELWLRGAAQKRQRAIARELPDFLDILAVTVTAGLALRTALGRVAQGQGDSPLSDEVDRVLTDMRLGMSRRDAFEALRQRNDAPALHSWVTSMLQAEELGAPISETLQDIAQEVRRVRAAEVKKATAKAIPKISLVVTTIIVPASLLLVVSALFLSQADVFGDIFGG